MESRAFQLVACYQSLAGRARKRSPSVACFGNSSLENAPRFVFCSVFFSRVAVALAVRPSVCLAQSRTGWLGGASHVKGRLGGRTPSMVTMIHPDATMAGNSRRFHPYNGYAGPKPCRINGLHKKLPTLHEEGPVTP